ncbi:short-chain dehydrogenase/reductase [Luteibacter rhizovicinus DSM 16549]|uniref:Short-chain dehydrogenase/reductase n=1 Tax=Luteibacter rhizovicinus DSM 16549 TaxID=1440763 RepID=A0A0G9HJQ9_9GAMM|nr:SDR family NAD(P)-dependent oxidoreductase [Luteibacter rhizovicinus]APG05309.1 short-chain dehydrogenase/reductase [Luteibacter rhizovicinus DSM 16549]KLD67932.1 oxidoreductase [Luteibacter rhizovicinus DSM 16549]KLD76083.1 oxidoreductase [Xanthomonas hyacinthi DSM 19077]
MSQVWLISGSGAGLGRDIAEAALTAGHRVVATARRVETLDALRTRFPDTLKVTSLDVADEAACIDAVRFTLDAFGQLDVLVNNAGYGQLVPFEQMSSADYRAQIETNLFGVVNLTRAAVRSMRERRSGRVINVSSVGGRIGTPGMSAYQAAKWAVGGLSEVLAAELGALGVHVTAIEPGGMRTDWARRAGADLPSFLPDYEASVGALRNMLSGYAGNETGDPVRVAEVVLRLAAHPRPPVRLLLGSDAATFAGQVEQARRETDQRWAEVSRSTDIGAGAMPAFPAY